MPDPVTAPVTATVIRAAQASATITSHTPAVTAWARRYFGPWWSATTTPPEALDTSGGAVITAEVDPNGYRELAGHVQTNPREGVLYARAQMLLSRADDGSVTAVSRDQRLAYHASADTRSIHIAGVTELAVNQAACRLARDAVRAQLSRDGWTLLHASAVTRSGRTVLALGGKGAGKTTTALILARTGQWELLANDRVFARGHDLGVQILPWPAAAAIGLGLLDALGLFDLARDRLQAGEHLHPTQDQRVTQALLDGHRAPLREPAGRELKAQVFPDQLANWFGLQLSTACHAAALLFPTTTPTATPGVNAQQRGLTETDFFSQATEDRYPDIFSLQDTDPAAQRHTCGLVAEQLTHLPHHSVTLGHDADGNARLLEVLLAKC